MRLLVATATLLALTTTATGAWAADPCAHDPATISPDSRIASIFYDGFVVDAGQSVSCPETVAVPIPNGMFGVYKVDARGFILNSGDGAIYLVQHGVQTQQSSFAGMLTEDTFFSHYFGSGPSAGFTGTFTYDLTAASVGARATLETIDFLAGYTTLTSVQGSINALADEQTGIVTRLNATGDLLLGHNQPLEAPDNFSLFGAVGSHTFGATGHYNLSEGFSLEGGGALTDQSLPGASFTGPSLGAALRYVQPGADTFRPFAEAGFNAAPGLGMTFSRHYDDGTPLGTTISSTASGNLFGVFAEAGVLVAPTPDDEISFTGSLIHNWLGFGGFTETIGDTNLFPATVAAATSTFDTIKANLAWTTKLSSTLDLTLSGAVGKTFSHDGVAANVAFVGPIAGTSQDETFAEYGVRLGWKLNAATTADTFIFGTSGATSGTHVQVGEALHVAF
jgi:hypothetical protein